jgi:hypothetical protein
MSRSMRSAGIAIVATLIASAVGAQPKTAGDACSLLSKEDAAAALGDAATGPKATGPMTDGTGSTVSGCGYEGAAIHRIQLSLLRLPASTLSTFKAMCEEKRSGDLAGLGDVACWYNDKHEELHVIKGNALVNIQLRRGGSPTEPIIAAMKKALAKLK